MEQIKFRAKAINTNRWIYGHYFVAPLTVENFGVGFLSTPDGKRIHCIESDGVVWQIDEKTLGQFTGLLDKNDQEIYGGDIYQDIGGGGRIARLEILFDERFGTWSGRDLVGVMAMLACPYENKNGGYKQTGEVLGNIYENPELLK